MNGNDTRRWTHVARPTRMARPAPAVRAAQLVQPAPTTSAAHAASPARAALVLSALFAVLATLALLAAPAQRAHADELGDSFIVAAAQQDGSYVLRPTNVPYQPGETVLAALQRADIGFAFTTAGTIESICGVAPATGAYLYSFTDYESRDSGMLSAVQASSITALYVSSADVGAIAQGHTDLLDCIRAYELRSDGLKNYPDAAQAYARAVDGLPAAANAQAVTIAEDFQSAIAAYDAIMAGDKHAVSFVVKKGDAAVEDAQVALRDIYGNETSAVHKGAGVYEAQVVALPYSYEVLAADGLDGVRCPALAISESTTVDVALPEGEWFNAITLRVRAAGNATCSTAGTSAVNRTTQTLRNIVPDAVLPITDLAVYAVPGDSIRSQRTAYPLHVVYAGADGGDHDEYVAYESLTYRPPYLVETGAQGAEFVYEVRHSTDSSLLTYQFQRCNASITRSATLKALSVAEGQAELLAGFSAYANSYDVYTSADELAITPQALGAAAEGYEVRVNGAPVREGQSATIAVPETARTNPYPVQVAATLNGLDPNTYTVNVHKVNASTVNIAHDADVTVEVANDAGGTVQPVERTATQTTFKLLEGRSYTYTATKEEHFHATCSFTAVNNATLRAQTPPTEPALTGFDLGRNNLWGEGCAFEKDPASTLHDQRFYVPDNWSSQSWLRAYPTNEAAAAGTQYKYQAMHERQDTGVQVTSSSSSFVPATSGSGATATTRISGGLQGFTTVSGYSNTATFTVTTGTDAVTKAAFSQDYRITAERVLSLAGLGASTAAGTVKLMVADTATSDEPTYGFDREIRDYLVPVPAGTDSLQVRYTFPRPISSESPKSGGYSVVLDGVETAYQPGATISQDVALDTASHEQAIAVTVRHVDPATPDATYRIVVRQMPKETVRFFAQPADATITVTDDQTGDRVYAQPDGSYELISGYSYTYTAAARGYVGKSDSFLASDGLEIGVALSPAPVNPTVDPSLKSHWPYFRADADNNAVVSAKTPIPASDPADDPLLYWATKLGSGMDSGAAGCPILVDGFLYTYAGDKIYKMDTVTGEIVAQGTMVGTSSFAITPMTYAEGMVFVALSNGRVEAFNAATLESLWVYTSPHGGQPNCPIAYSDGCVYTGFWNWSSTCDFVCLTVADEDPTTPGSATVDDPAHPGQTMSAVLDAKVALWSYPHEGGFYWAGAWAGSDYVIVGSDDASITAGLEVDKENEASGTLFSLDARTGQVLDTVKEYPGGVKVGNIRSTVMRDAQTGRFYYCGRAGYLCSVAVNADGTFDHSSVQAIRLRNDASDGGISATSTPVVYNGRAYVGADHGAYNAYDGQSIDVVDLATGTVAYTVNMQGRAQASGLLTTGYVDEDGYVYVYYFDNYSPGKLRCFKDKPGQTTPQGVSTETATVGGKTATYGNMAQVVFSPRGPQAQYCICSPIADEYGTIYFKNDTAYTMALGSPIEKIEVVQQPTVLEYGVGETFDPAGMKVQATYANGATRDITDYVQCSTAKFESEGVVDVPIVFPYTMYQSGPSGQNIGAAPDYNYAKPQTTVRVTVGTAVAPRLTTTELPRAQAPGSMLDAKTPYEVQFTATGAPRSFTWTIEGDLPSGLSFDEETATISGEPERGTGGAYPITVRVSNGVGAPASTDFTLEVYQKPSVSADLNMSARTGEAFSYQVKASGYPKPFVYLLQDGFTSTQGWTSHTPTGWSIDEKTGVISGTTEETGTFHLRAFASNEAGLSSGAHLRVNVSGAPQILTGSLPGGVKGREYAAALEADAYPSAAWSWQAAEGSQLPAGLSLNAETGAVEGTPTTAGTYRVVATAANENGQARREFTVQITDAPTAPAIVTASFAQAALNQPYNAPVQATGAPAPAITVTGLPDGLVYDARTGAVSGTPTRAAEYDVTIAATNEQGADQKTLKLVVAVAPTIETEALGTPVDESETGFVLKGQPANLPLQVAGSPAPAIAVTGLPAGLRYDADARAIVGTPFATDEAGATVTVRADNGVGEAAERLYTLRVYESPTLGAETWAQASYWQQYDQDLQIGGAPAPTVVVTGLASGLRYDKATGKVSGIPTMRGVFDVQVSATNAAGSIKKTVKLTVGAPATIGATELPNAYEGLAYDAPLRVAGEPAPTVQVTGLPEGLAYDSGTGSIAGMVAGDAGAYTVNVKASNGVGDDAEAMFTLNVLKEVHLETAALENAIVGTPYNARLQFSKPLQSAAVNNLPKGLALAFEAGNDYAEIEGTPEKADEQGVGLVVQATAQDGAVMTGILPLVVEPREKPVSLAASKALFPWARDHQASVNLADELQASGRPAPSTWAVAAGSQLPPGLSLDGATGELSGAPTQVGSYAFDVTCGNGVGEPARASLTLEVLGAPAFAPEPKLPPAAVGTPYAASVAAGDANPAPTYTWEAATGSSTPPGLNLDPGIGAITGVPTQAGTYVFAVRAANGQGEAEATLTLVVAPAPGIGVTALPDGLVGASYSASVAPADAGDALTYTWQAARGSSLPAGLALDSATGTVSGTPAARGAYQVVVTASNGLSTASAPLTLVVKQRISDAQFGSIATPTYTGRALTPAIALYAPNAVVGTSSVADSQSVAGKGLVAAALQQQLKQGSDYTLAYRNNVNAGTNTAQVVVTGAGLFTGSVTKNFSIAKAKQPLVAKAAKKSFAVKLAKLKKKKQTTPKVLKVTKAQGKVTYAKVKVNKKKLAKKFTVNKKTGKIAVAKGTKKGAYKITVKATAAGNGNYLAGSKQVVVKVVVK